MLRIKTLGASALALIASAGFAAAADLGSYEPPPAPIYTPAPAFTWTGPYVGLQGGYGWGTGDGWVGGAYMGYNFQTGTNWVLGIEGDINAANKSGGVNNDPNDSVSNTWDGSVRGRVGYAADRFLVYGTGGVLFGNVKGSNNITTESTTKVGWTVGAGVEAALTDNVVGRVELRHKNLGSVDFGNIGTQSFSSNDVMVGIGVKF